MSGDGAAQNWSATMLDPEGDSRPPIPGDGGAPPAIDFNQAIASMSLADLAILTQVVLRQHVKRAHRGELHGVVKRAISQLLTAASDRLDMAGSQITMERLLIAESALVLLTETRLRECEVCNDVGVVSRGEPCPTGCAASERATREPERPQGPTDPINHPASDLEDCHPA